MKHKLEITKGLLLEMYPKYSQAQIAKELGVSEKTIRRRFKEFNIPIVKPKKKLKPKKQKPEYHYKDKFQQKYNELQSLVLMAKYYNANVKTMWEWKNKHDIETIKGVSEDKRTTEVGAFSYRDRETLYKLYVEDKMSTYQIAEYFGCASTTIQYWITKHNIPTRNVSEQWDVSVKNGFKYIVDGKFNKTLYLNNCVNIDKLNKTTYNFIIETVSKCQACGETEVLDLHHIDGNHRNNKPENHIVLCPNCHAKIHRLGYTINELCEIYESWIDMI